MKIIFQLHYNTRWGENLYVSGSTLKLGNNDESKAVPMTYVGDGFWKLIIDEKSDEPSFAYNYLIKRDNITIKKELKSQRIFVPDKNSFSYFLNDRWADPSLETIFSTDAFVHTIFRRDQSIHAPSFPTQQNKWITLQVEFPLINSDEEVAIVGNNDMFGNWDDSKAISLNDTHFPIWQITFQNDDNGLALSYKFIVRKKEKHSLVSWEYGENRQLEIAPNAMDHIVISGLVYRNSSTHWRAAGVAIPVFSLRTHQSFGIGEFLDLKKMIDWATLTEQRMIQVLPINDTTMTNTWEDTYPYNANSTYALHPMYLNLDAVAPFRDAKQQERYNTLRVELNHLPEIDYEKVRILKDEFIEQLFLQDNGKTFQTKEYKEFFEQNSFWLKPYAAFRYYRDKYLTPDRHFWGEDAIYDPQKTEELCSETNDRYPRIALHFFTQFHLHRQLSIVHRYAQEKKVILKGDIPIGISRDSVDAWVSLSLFNMNSQAGAPPDDFSIDGQNWGFPTYNWDKMALDGYAWWRSRFHKMEEYFDAYRIDHILGFFRIWEIPLDCVQGLLGHFNPAMPYSENELQSFGFYFDHQRHCKPYITQYVLDSIFGEYTSEITGRYVVWCDGDIYRLRSECDTQRKIEALFGDCDNDDKAFRIRNGLYRLVADVLFVEDPYEVHKYHPRISGHNTFSYECLNDYEKDCYNKLYVHFYYHRHNEFWKDEAMKKLPALINASNMLVCGEDLGMIPETVPQVMSDLEIISLEVQRMPKESNLEFGNTNNYPYLSLCTTSTHDMSGIRSWWEEDFEKTKRYFRFVLHEQGEAPKECEPWICERIIDMHLQSPSILAVFPWQDWLSMSHTLRRSDADKERINIPAVPRHYWRYRMHIYIEDLLLADEFNTQIKNMIYQSGRVY